MATHGRAATKGLQMNSANIATRETKFLRIRQVTERTSLHRSTIYERIKSSDFPPPIRLGGNISVWVSTEIDGWMEAKVNVARAAMK